MKFYVSALTKKAHLSKRCSVTYRNHALNLETPETAETLVAYGYQGCKRCGAYDAIEAARAKYVAQTPKDE